MKTFKQAQTYIIKHATKENACSSELRRAKNATTKDDLLAILRDNISWVTGHKLFNGVNILEYFTTAQLIEYNIGNVGADNTGLANSGNWNSGYRNSGDSNSGNWNSGNRNSGDRNSGYRNSGDSNSGDSNSGNWNSGDWNSGNWNSGNWNSGDRNSGDRNSGYSNSGNWNSGYRNSGYSNSGNWNSGNRNSGNWNSGDRNSGDSNSGYRNSGAFCLNPNPKLILFDKECDITVKEWENSRPCQLMNSLDPTIWVPANMMSPKEKEAHPKYETTEGYLKTIPMTEAWSNFWGNLPESDKQLFLDLPGFDASIFFQITGIKVN